MAKLRNQRQIREAQASIMALGANLERKVRSATEKEVDNLISQIETQIAAKGLAGNDPTDKPGQPPLVASFDSDPSGSSQWTIYSTAEHAMALEEGADPHEINPDNAQLLSWVPENPAAYPTREDVSNERGYVVSGTWYDADKGLVFSTGVQHPGNDAHHFIRDAQIAWAPIAHAKIDTAIDQAIIESGFTRSTGDGGRIPDPDWIGAWE